MARIPRLLVKGNEAIYHIISKTALEGFIIGDIEKEYLFGLINRLSSVFMTEMFGFCIMGNHFHLLVKMKNPDDYSDEEIRDMVRQYYQDNKRQVTDGQIPFYREKLSNLSEYVKEIKQRFARYYNKQHRRSGYFWGDRFKSVIVEDGDTLINCLAYIDLNPVRANMVEKPEDYRWSSIGYHIQTGNNGNFLSTDFGLNVYEYMTEAERLKDYREFLYKKGALEVVKGASIGDRVIEKERDKNYELTTVDRLRYKTRYFTDSGIIGTKGFVSRHYEQFKDYFNTSRKKNPKKISGFKDIYSLKTLVQ